MRRLVLIVLIGTAAFLAEAEKYVRYNLVGYTPGRDKRLIIMSDESCKGEDWEIKDGDGNVVLSGSVGKSLIGKSKHTSHPFNHEVKFSKLKSVGTYTFHIPEVVPQTIKISEKPYEFITSEILRYLRVSRSASEDCLDHQPSHFGDSSCVIFRRTGNDNTSWKMDRAKKVVNMSGGWYDAGDYIKFTLTIAYTTFQLLQSYEENPDLFTQQKWSKSELYDVLDEAKWGLEYLMKTMPDSNEFIIQTGGYLDHEQGSRLPEDDELDGRRECYSAFSSTQMGYSAAALALGAKLFKERGDEDLSQKYKQMAIKIYSHTVAGSSPAWFEKDWQIFYDDQSPSDNLELAATELYRLTGDKKYLNDAKKHANAAGAGGWSSWGDFNIIAHNRLIDDYAYAVMPVMEDLEIFLKISEQPGNVWGVPHEYTWATLYSFLGVGSGSLMYESRKKSKLYRKLSLNVLDYTLGMNNWGATMVCSPSVPSSVKNVYSQIYKLQPDLFPTGAIAEGPGDRATHEELKKYYELSSVNPFEKFNTSEVVFYDNNTNFQTMETTIGGVSDAFLFFTLIDKLID